MSQKISQLTQITTPAGTDELYVVQGGQSLRATLTQLATYVEGNLDADLIPFDDASVGGLVSNLVGAALRELDDNFDNYVNYPQIPSIAYSLLPAASAYPRAVVYCVGTNNGDVPIYSDGTYWKYFSDDSIVYSTMDAEQLDILGFAPTVDTSEIFVPAASIGISTDLPDVVTT